MFVCIHICTHEKTYISLYTNLSHALTAYEVLYLGFFSDNHLYFSYQTNLKVVAI